MVARSVKVRANLRKVNLIYKTGIETKLYNLISTTFNPLEKM